MSDRIPRHIATLGHSEQLTELRNAAERSNRWQWVASYDTQDAQIVNSAGPNAAAEGSWESLLSGNPCDWVAVAEMPRDAAAAGRRGEQLKRLVQAGVPLMLIHPACDMLLAYELDMNRSDGGGPIQLYCPLADHPRVRALCAAVRSNATELGSFEQCLCERFAGADQRTQEHVLAHVARDALIVRRLLGDISSVSASGVSEDGAQWGNLGIHFTGPGPLIARWSIGPRHEAAGLKLTLIGDRNSISAWIPDGGHDVALTEHITSVSDSPETWQPADEFLQRLAENGDAPKSVAWTTWDEACRSLEVTDAVERSIRRKRTIELYHEQVTEQETFKSVMAAGGCGMLLWVLMLLLIAGVVEGLHLPLRETFIWRLWPVFLFVPLAVFLALQLLQLVFPRNARHNDI